MVHVGVKILQRNITNRFNGYFIGVPTVIGSNGVEKIVEFHMNDEEKEQLNQTLNAVKNTVSETGL